MNNKLSNIRNVQAPPSFKDLDYPIKSKKTKPNEQVNNQETIQLRAALL